MTKKEGIIGLVVVLAMAALAACGGGAAPKSTHYVGKVEGTDAYIGIARNGAGVTAYVCDGQSVATWFKGKANGDGSIDLTSADGSKLQGTLSGDTFSGSFTPAGGAAQAYTASKASGDAGLYRLEETADGGTVVGGWVVLADGSLRGAKVGPAGFASQRTRDPKASWTDPDPAP